MARYGQATYEELAEAMKKIELSGANMLGFMLNDVERHPFGYYRYGRYGYYSYGYGYGYSRRRNQSANVGDAPSSDAAFLDALADGDSPGA